MGQWTRFGALKAPVEVTCFTWLVIREALSNSRQLAKEGHTTSQQMLSMWRRRIRIKQTSFCIVLSLLRLGINVLSLKWVMPNSPADLSLLTQKRPYQRNWRRLGLHMCTHLAVHFEGKKLKTFWRNSSSVLLIKIWMYTSHFFFGVKWSIDDAKPLLHFINFFVFLGFQSSYPIPRPLWM